MNRIARAWRVLIGTEPDHAELLAEIAKQKHDYALVYRLYERVCDTLVEIREAYRKLDKCDLDKPE